MPANAELFYNGLTTATVTGCSVATLADGDVVGCTAASASFADPTAGVGKTVTATRITTNGADAGNDALSSASATTTANITYPAGGLCRGEAGHSILQHAASGVLASTASLTVTVADSTAQQWIFNISTHDVKASVTYRYAVTLNDASIISFQFGVK